MAFHNSLKFGRQFVAGPAGADRDPVRLEVAFGRQARRVEGVAGVERYVRGGPVGVAVPVLYQRPDGSAHVINAVRTGSKDPVGRGVVVLWDPQRGEEAGKADVSAVTGMWVIPVPEPVAGPAGMVVLPPSGSGLRSQGWGSGLPTEVTGKAGPKGAKRTRAETGESSSGAKRRKVTAAAAGIDPGSPGNDESELLTPTDQATQQDERSARRKQQTRARNAKYRQRLRAEADRVVVLEELAGRGPLTEEQAAELAELQPKVAQRKQKKKENKANYRQGLRAEADRVAELEELAGQGPLPEEQTAELAELQPKVAQRKQKEQEDPAKYRRARKAEAARVTELAGRGPLTEEQAAELAELQPKVARPVQQDEQEAERKEKRRASDAKYRQGLRAAADRVAVLEELAGRGPLTEEQAAELAELQPKAAQRKQKQKKDSARHYQGLRAAADRVVVLEELEGRGELTEEQAAELAELQSKETERKEKHRARDVKYYQAKKAAADRVVVLEELEGRGSWLRSRRRSWRSSSRRWRSGNSKRRQRARRSTRRERLLPIGLWCWRSWRGGGVVWGAGGGVGGAPAEGGAVETAKEGKEREGVPGEKGYCRSGCGVGGVGGAGELSGEQAAELAELRAKVVQWKQQEREKGAKQYQGKRVVADRVVVLEELEGRGSCLGSRRRSWRSSGRRWCSGSSKSGKRARRSTRREGLLPIGLWCWRSWRGGGVVWGAGGGVGGAPAEGGAVEAAKEGN